MRVDKNDRPRVTDFGLAKRVEAGESYTRSGEVLGSPAFIPPERASGQHRRVGRRGDVYALGAILYQLLTGRVPFVGQGLAETLDRVLHADPVRPRWLNPAVPEDMETICLKCLEKEPERRYPSARALAEELGRWLEERPILARPLGVRGRSRRWCRRNPVVAALVVGLIVSVVSGHAGVLSQLRRARNAELAARRGEYAVDMNPVQREWESGDLVRAVLAGDRTSGTRGRRRADPSKPLRAPPMRPGGRGISKSADGVSSVARGASCNLPVLLLI